MKRAHRLRSPNQFQRVRREGRTYQQSGLLLNVAPNRRRKTRCGFVVGKRIGSAVRRNRARRRVRETVRLAYGSIRAGFDLVFVIRADTVAEMPFQDLQHTVELLLRKAGLWQTQPVQGSQPSSSEYEVPDLRF